MQVRVDPSAGPWSSGQDGGGWTRLLTATQATSYEYVGQYGHSYTFRVQATDNVSNVGDWAEASTAVVQVTKYYAFGGQRVAMREGDVVYYLHGDHLGSTSVATTAAGALHSRQFYYPYGETRYAAGSLPTDYQFTGQRAEGFGLYDYHARFYDPYLNRFISADTIVPDPILPQAFNRYSYVLNNPLRYVDPSGHCIPGVNCPGDADIGHRDLTPWFYPELVTQAIGPEVAQMAATHREAESTMQEMINGPIVPRQESLAAVVLFDSMLPTYPMWIELVGDGARWDFKDQIMRRPGPGESIMLGGEWYEYSVPGNVFYGYIGRAAGFESWELHIGASIAQIQDAFRPDDPCTPLDIVRWWRTYGDDSYDYAAIELGIELWERYKVDDMTMQRFLDLLAEYSPRLLHADQPSSPYYNPAWPYPVGYFDGGQR